ncbi:alpha/beta fold hydrolase [Effusibacillus dendaii]|uniref:Alpha/beta hydrolase n=1 Tax=Effusibacillus dendaii TaxID=2743772 RepID=A0A7I8DH16_9BACL|nr:alpha/beta fold hydrolase [Effusibacillus dendaii]BCJ88299.1 alpha/beta hydrolase [Effusibacillus dendaii]
MASPIDEIYQVNDHVTFGVKIAGQGEPLVFLHGAGGLTWDPFLDELSNHYTVYAPHLPGTATSTGLENITNLWDLILCYYDLFDKLGLESANVVGHSLGGMIASELAATDQSRVSRLITIAPAGLFMADHPIPDIFAMLPEEMVPLVVADPSSPAAEMLRYVPEDLDERLELMIHQIQNMQAAAKFLWPIPDKGLKSRIHRIKSPTLIIWGREDRLIPLVYAEEFHNRIQGSELKIIDNASHLVTLEQTAEAISCIRDFLTTHQASYNK